MAEHFITQNQTLPVECGTFSGPSTSRRSQEPIVIDLSNMSDEEEADSDSALPTTIQAANFVPETYISGAPGQFESEYEILGLPAQNISPDLPCSLQPLSSPLYTSPQNYITGKTVSNTGIPNKQISNKTEFKTARVNRREVFRNMARNFRSVNLDVNIANLAIDGALKKLSEGRDAHLLSTPPSTVKCGPLEPRAITNAEELNSYLSNRVASKRLFTHFSYPTIHHVAGNLKRAFAEFQNNLENFVKESEILSQER